MLPHPLHDLQHFPDFKGIESNLAAVTLFMITCSTSLTSKGLRASPSLSPNMRFLQHFPDFKGIERCVLLYCKALTACSTSLTSKGLRLFNHIIESLFNLQHLPDFKGIHKHKNRPVNVYRPVFCIAILMHQSFSMWMLSRSRGV